MAKDILRIGAAWTQTPDDIELQHVVTQEILRRNREAGCATPPIDSRSWFDCDDYHAGCHIAFRRLVDLPVSVDLLVFDDWLDRPNGQLPNGWDYKVKQTHYRRGELSAVQKYTRRPLRDILYLLFTRRGYTYTFRGWEHGAFIVQRANHRWYGSLTMGYGSFNVSQAEIAVRGPLPITGPIVLPPLPPDDTKPRQVKRQPRHIGRREAHA